MKAVSIRVALSIVACFFFLTGCHRRHVVKSPDKETDAERPGENVVAIVGDQSITEAEVEALLKRAPQRRRKELREQAIGRLLDNRVFAQEALKVGLDRDPQVQKDLRRAIDTILAQRFVQEEIGRKAVPSQEDIRQYYEKHTARFVIPEGVHIQHILVKRRDHAEEILAKLKEGTSFETLAKKESLASSYKTGGDLGWLYRGRMDPNLEKVVFDLEVGKLSPLIETKEGYEIVKVLGKADGKKLSLEEVAGDIYTQLLQRKKRALINQYYEKAMVDKEPSKEGVLVKVGDRALTEEDLAPILAKLPENMSKKKRKREEQDLRQRWIRFFVDKTVFSQAARESGFDDVPEIAAELAVKRYEVLAEAFEQRFILDKVRVSEEDISNYYKLHREEFRAPLRARVRAIVVETRKEAEQILKKIDEGAAFSHMAIKKSIHPSAPRGGELGWFGEGQMDPELEKVAFSLEPWEISGIFQTEAGYQIVRLIEKRGGNIKRLEEVAETIKMKLRTERIAQERGRYSKKVEVKIFGQ